MYNIMKNLIRRRYYATAEIAQEKLDVFFAVSRITDEQYTELTALVAEVYAQAE